MVSGYLSRQTKEWKLNILNGVHNHAMEPALEGHMLTGRLKEDDKKIVRYLTQSESTTIEDIFWAHPTSVKLFNNFPTVLVMDSTYKTNMYKMPMFEIVGVTSTDLTYSVGFGFVTHEKCWSIWLDSYQTRGGVNRFLKDFSKI
jgi:hypothetical protein